MTTKFLPLCAGLLLIACHVRADGHGSGIGLEIHWKVGAKNRIVQAAVVNHTSHMVYVARFATDDPKTMWPAMIKAVFASGKEIPTRKYFPYILPKNVDSSEDAARNEVDDVAHYIKLAPGKEYITESAFETYLLLGGLNCIEFRYVGFIWIRRQANPDFATRPEKVTVSSNLLTWERK